MKKVIAACIDLTLGFDSVEECNQYAEDIRKKKQRFNVLEYEEYPDGKVRTRIQKQYNNSPFPTVEKGGARDEIQ